jgi:glutaredoxin
MSLNQKGEIMFRGLLIVLLFAGLLVTPLVTPLTSTLAHASEVFRWLDERGSVHYSDQPPPPSAKQILKVRSKGNVVDVDKESFDTRRARDKNPVVLYASACGPLCDQARDHLTQRGIPFTLKDPSKEPEIAVELKKLAGALEVPVIVIGKIHQKGFDMNSWDSLLDSAGYPKTALIPSKPNPGKQP